MLESVVFMAFLMGIASALSLPMGTLTSFVWRPGDRTTASIMAFGGGALLAALAIDLVAKTVEEGHYPPLAVGAIAGGLLFIALNEVINNYGGFLRKASTTLYHLRKKQYQQSRKILSSVHQVDLFDDLPDADYKALAASIQSLEITKGKRLYLEGDPSDHLYIVAAGEIELLWPKDDRSTARVSRDEAIGWYDFLTGAPFAQQATAIVDTTVWKIPRSAFVGLVRNSSTLLQKVQLELLSSEVTDYLEKEHGLTVEAVREWQSMAGSSLMRSGSFPPAQKIERYADEFIEATDHFSHLGLFNHLPENELLDVADRLVSREFQADEAIVHQGDESDRLYIVQHGDLRLIDPHNRAASTLHYRDNDVFGFRAFISGASHTLTAVATQDSRIWMLRRSDFEELIRTQPQLRERVNGILQQDYLSDYLQQRHNYDPDRVERWKRRAIDAVKAAQPVPRISGGFDLSHHKGAPLAIWLGLALDGIPEALVIGALVSQSKLGLSLLAGLFLSNYPEALSSSIGMRQQGMRRINIFLMWSSLMLVVGLIAAAGATFFADVGPNTYAFTEGLAAGAMLTMIAQTMLPEAYIKGGNVVGFSTLLGFLAAVSFKAVG